MTVQLKLNFNLGKTDSGILLTRRKKRCLLSPCQTYFFVRLSLVAVTHSPFYKITCYAHMWQHFSKFLLFFSFWYICYWLYCIYLLLISADQSSTLSHIHCPESYSVIFLYIFSWIIIDLALPLANCTCKFLFSYVMIMNIFSYDLYE